MLPPSYEKESNKKYPVLYFLHGLGENEQALMRSGGWGLIEDLQREHKVGDFIISDMQRGLFVLSLDTNLSMTFPAPLPTEVTPNTPTPVSVSIL